jgi:hypothetical protein
MQKPFNIGHIFWIVKWGELSYFIFVFLVTIPF